MTDDKALIVRVPKSMHQALKQRAVEEDRTMSQVVRRAMKSYLAANPPHEES